MLHTTKAHTGDDEGIQPPIWEAHLDFAIQPLPRPPLAHLAHCRERRLGRAAAHDPVESLPPFAPRLLDQAHDTLLALLHGLHRFGCGPDGAEELGDVRRRAVCGRPDRGGERAVGREGVERGAQWRGGRAFEDRPADQLRWLCGEWGRDFWRCGRRGC